MRDLAHSSFLGSCKHCEDCSWFPRNKLILLPFCPISQQMQPLVMRELQAANMLFLEFLPPPRLLFLLLEDIGYISLSKSISNSLFLSALYILHVFLRVLLICCVKIPLLICCTHLCSMTLITVLGAFGLCYRNF